MVSRCIRRAELLKLVQLSDSTIYTLEKQGLFPRRFALTERCVVWDYDEVAAWLDAKKSEARDSSSKPDVSLRKTRPVAGGGHCS